MAEERLYPFEGHPALQQVRRNRVAQRVRADLFGNTSLACQGFYPQITALLTQRPAFIRIKEEG
jgi:hypothetical protein